MNQGKEICKNLREIRKYIAKEYDIELITQDCPFQGDCKGTCPKCEEELRFLEEELRKRNIKSATIKIMLATSLIGVGACGSGISTAPTEATISSSCSGGC